MALVRSVGLPRGSGLWGGERLGAGRASGRYFFEHYNGRGDYRDGIH